LFVVGAPKDSDPAVTSRWDVVRRETAVLARRRRWAGAGLAFAVCLAGLGGSWALTVAVDRVQQHSAGLSMDRYTDDVSQAVANEADRYGDTLTDLSAAVGADSNFRDETFAQITSRLNRRRFSGATGVFFAVPAADDEIVEVQTFWRAHGAAGLRLAPVGTGVEHMLLVIGRNFDGTATGYGRDLSQAPEPAEALRMSRDAGQVMASPSYVLFKDRALSAGQRQLSFLLAAPVTGGVGTPDAGRFRGWVLMGMRGGDFIDETLRSRSRGVVTVTLIDLSTGQPKVVAHTGGRPPTGAGRLDRERMITVGRHDWQLRVYPTDALMTSTDRRRPTVALGLGVLVTLLLTALVGVLAGARNRAMTEVDRATAALREDIERRRVIEARLREREGELKRLAFHDPLTGLANRTLFYERVEHALATHSRSTATMAVLYIDLDGFKQINDNLGHTVGDAVLIEVAVRLRRCVRDSDTVARFGGDEFAALFEDISAPDDAETVADRVVRAIQSPFDIDGHTCHITASVGVALRQPGDPTADTILRDADNAMYVAKASGKGCFIIAEADPPDDAEMLKKGADQPI
jgi:diguanylate cyclase (GGDEF)-like protein